MSTKTAFIEDITNGYLSKGESIILGGAILDGEAIADVPVKIPLIPPQILEIACPTLVLPFLSVFVWFELSVLEVSKPCEVSVAVFFISLLFYE